MIIPDEKPKLSSDFGRILPLLDSDGMKKALDWLLKQVIGTGTQIEKQIKKYRNDTTFRY